MQDIYYKVGSSLCEQGWDDASIDEKKKMIDHSLKSYIISKFEERNIPYLNEGEAKDVSVTELLQILANNIPKDEHHTTLNHFIHCILNIAGDMQLHSITWWQEKDPVLIEFPLIEFTRLDGSEKWDNLATHEKTDYVKTFEFVYSIFQSESFMSKDNNVKKIGQAPSTKNNSN